MAKAEIILSDGTKMNIDGTPEEIIKIKQSFIEFNIKAKSNVSKITRKRSGSKSKILSKEGPLSRIRDLIKNNFFKEERNIEDIRKKLEEKAIFYQVTALSPSLIRLVKKGELRRLKEDNRWEYVNS